MRKFKKLAKKAVAFSMATVLTWSGFLSSFMGNAFEPVSVQAAEITGTKGADIFSWDNATVYFLLTDRFKNGDTSNDHSYNRGLDQNGNVINVSDERATFHGGDFAGVTQAINDGYFTDLGVNAIWISAPYEQIHGYIVGGDGSPSFAHYSYHGYYVLDYTNTDANFGTAEEFRTLVDTAHEKGIRVIIDVVLNHAGYNSLYDMNEFGFGVVKDGWDDYYYSMANVNNKDYHSYIDYEADASLWSKWWGPDWVRAGLPGYTEGGGDPYTMSLAGLPDFKTESSATVGIPAFLEKKWKEEGRYDEEVAELKNYLSSNGYSMTVTNCISYWLSTWVREFGVDGFRCDTAKHVKNESWAVLHDMCTDALKEWKAENPDKKLDDLEFWMTGEAWDHGVGYDDYYKTGKFDSMINFDTTGGGVLALGTVGGKYKDYAGAINSRDDFNVLSYMSSHDSTLARGDMIHLGSALLMLPGGVQIFYGDETNRPLDTNCPFDGNGGAGHSLRSDMNWDAIDEEVLAHWQKVGTFRNNHIAVGAGQHTAATATSGVAFTRTYSKNGVTDRIAAVIGATKNSTVTIDVNGVWNDGDVVTNYYDNSSATVTGGKVTFSTGATGTVLIGDPDGKPLVSITGNAKFKGTQTVKVSIKEADSAIVSVDGGRKFKVVDGDTFTIGDKAYEGDTITITYKAENEKGTINGKTTFYRAFEDEEFEEEEEEEVVTPSKLSVKMADGSAPFVHIWQGEETNLTGAWPGKQLTQKDSEGYYYIELSSLGSYDAKQAFNVVINNGAGAQTGDIKGLKGDVKVDVSSSYTHTITGGTVDIPVVKNTITIRVKPYGSQVPHLYVWNDAGNYNGGFPGKQLTEKDENGNYIFVLEGQAMVNCIVGSGSNQNQSSDITGITGEALITINSDDYGDNKVEKTAKAESKFALMKKEAKLIKNMEASEYTSSSWKALYSLLAEADKLVAQREENADPAAVTDMYNKIIAAKKALVLSAPVVTKASSGSKVVKGVAAAESTVTVTIGGKEYTAVADECTGVWTITANANLTSSSTIKTTATRESLSSATGNASLSNGNINIDNPYDDDNNNDDNNNDDNNDNNDNNDDNVTSLSVTSKASATSVVVGDSVKLTATATGGTGSYKYSYIVHNTTTGKWSRIKDKITSNTYTWKAGSAGTRIFYIDVTDGSGKTVRATGITVKTTKTSTEELKVTSKASDTSITVGDSIKLTATATGGSGSYKYSYIVYNKTTGKWARIKDKITSNTYTWKAKSAGTRVFYIDVTDGSGKTVRATGITVKTTKANSIDAVASSTASSVSIGNTVSIIGTASGGTGSYTYSFVVYNEATNSWYRHAFSSSCVLNWKATSKGTRKFYVEAKDANGNVKRSEAVTITVK